MIDSALMQEIEEWRTALRAIALGNLNEPRNLGCCEIAKDITPERADWLLEMLEALVRLNT
jgi:hypothetical protein